MTPKFIVFEGIDGAGKTTQIKLLAENLAKIGVESYITAEPTDMPSGKIIREALSGRLPVTFYRSIDDLPPFEDYALTGRTYRYFKGEVVYPFGYGKSYADIREVPLSPYEVIVENHSDMTADYVALCYDEDGALCDFRRLTLSPFEKKTVVFEKYR